MQQLNESDELTQAFVRLYEKRDAIRAHLNETLPGYIARADEARKALEELVNACNAMKSRQVRCCPI